MNRVIRTLVCVCLVPLAAASQERISKIGAGPMDKGHYGIAFVVTEHRDFGSSKIQSLSVTLPARIADTEMPTEFLVDLAATYRSVASGSTKRKNLVLRWGQSGEVEVRCEDGKWARQAVESEVNRIIETVKAVVREAPLGRKEFVEFSVPAKLERTITAILEDLGDTKVQCVKDSR